MADKRHSRPGARRGSAETVELCRLALEMPYSQIDAWAERAAARGMALDAYVIWAVELAGQLRLVPMRGTCK